MGATNTNNHEPELHDVYRFNVVKYYRDKCRKIAHTLSPKTNWYYNIVLVHWHMSKIPPWQLGKYLDMTFHFINLTLLQILKWTYILENAAQASNKHQMGFPLPFTHTNKPRLTNYRTKVRKLLSKLEMLKLIPYYYIRVLYFKYGSYITLNNLTTDKLPRGLSRF